MYKKEKQQFKMMINWLCKRVSRSSIFRLISSIVNNSIGSLDESENNEVYGFVEESSRTDIYQVHSREVI